MMMLPEVLPAPNREVRSLKDSESALGLFVGDMMQRNLSLYRTDVDNGIGKLWFESDTHGYHIEYAVYFEYDADIISKLSVTLTTNKSIYYVDDVESLNPDRYYYLYNEINNFFLRG